MNDDPMKGYAAPNVLWEIRRERERQIAKGYDRKHDDEHVNGEIADAAYYYIGMRSGWPWNIASRPNLEKVRKRDRLIMAAALCVAEIERLDRIEARKAEVREPRTAAGGLD